MRKTLIQEAGLTGDFSAGGASGEAAGPHMLSRVGQRGMKTCCAAIPAPESASMKAG
jgi:hypothetical protein